LLNIQNVPTAVRSVIIVLFNCLSLHKFMTMQEKLVIVVDVEHSWICNWSDQIRIYHIHNELQRVGHKV